MSVDEPEGNIHAQSGWYPDPSGQHDLRYFDGRSWTDHVASNEQQRANPPMAPPPSVHKRPAAPPMQTQHSGGGFWEVTPPGGVTFGESLSRCLSKYANFKGRAPRSEYWWFFLAVWLAMMAALFIGDVMLGDPDVADAVAGFVVLGAALPWLAVTARRLHDTGKSGWAMLVSLIPLVGPILMLVWTATEGSREANQWGPPVSS